MLDALEWIRLTLDKSLLYRHSCHHGSCGTCACLINGRERLACTAMALELGSDTVVLEPLERMKRLGDLAVHPGRLFKEIPVDWSYLRESEWNPKGSPPEGVDHYARFESCIECGACVSACPATQDFMGPAALAALNRERINRPEMVDELLKRAESERGVWRCERALECSRVCPAGVYPARHIMELRKALRSERKR